MLTNRSCFLWPIGVLLLFAAPSSALPPNFGIQEVHPANFPTAIRFAPDGRLFFTELAGRVAYFPSVSSNTSVTWTTLNVAGGGERGLHGLAFHPDYPDSPFIYLAYTNSATVSDRLVRYRDQLGEATSPAIFIDYPGDADFHHGGRVAFGPDGMIYLTHGDQLDLAAAQTISDVRGKIMRLGRGGKPAPGNPWGPTNPAAAYGVRNPFGLCFDPLEGTGYFTENGPDCDDEINILSLGTNYGWGPDDDCFSTPAGARPPLAYLNPTIAPTGCAVYRGGVYPSRWDGSLFFGAYNTGNLYRVRFAPGRPDLVDTLDVFASFSDGILDVTVGPDGFLWVATSGKIYRILYSGAPLGVVDGPNVARTPDLRMGPNPFRSGVDLEIENASAGTRVDIFDVQGRRLRGWDVRENRLIRWDGRDDRGLSVPPGIYLVRMTAPDVRITRRLIRVG
jgi:glucose/arabinose dehydrogenase